MRGIGGAARAAAQVLALCPTEQKNRALRAAAAALRAHRFRILAANEADVREAVARATSGALLDRLRLNDQRVEAMARGTRGRRASLPIPSASTWRNGPGRTAC